MFRKRETQLEISAADAFIYPALATVGPGISFCTFAGNMQITADGLYFQFLIFPAGTLTLSRKLLSSIFCKS